MNITQKGPADPELAQLASNDNEIGSAGREADATAQPSGESAKVDISPEAYKLQRVAELARIGDHLRAEKVKQIKEKIAADQFQVDSKEVAKSIVRSEVSRLLEKK